MATGHVYRHICHSPAHHCATNEKLVKLLAALLAERQQLQARPVTAWVKDQPSPR